MKINGEIPTGAMIALRPENSWDLAVEGGEEAAALHVTLKFLGDAADWTPEQRRDLCMFLAVVWRQRRPFEARVTGVERFGEEKDAIVLTLDAPELHVMHEDAHMATPHVPLTWPTYKPHLTMKYSKGAIPKEVEQLVGTTIRFSDILIAFGTDRHTLWMGENGLIHDSDIIAKKRNYNIPNPKSTPKEIVGSHGHRPAGTSILWPALYRHLRQKGYSKRKAAMISNGLWNKRHGKGPRSVRGVVGKAEPKKIESALDRVKQQNKPLPQPAKRPSWRKRVQQRIKTERKLSAKWSAEQQRQREEAAKASAEARRKGGSDGKGPKPKKPEDMTPTERFFEALKTATPEQIDSLKRFAQAFKVGGEMKVRNPMEVGVYFDWAMAQGADYSIGNDGKTHLSFPGGKKLTLPDPTKIRKAAMIDCGHDGPKRTLGAETLCVGCIVRKRRKKGVRKDVLSDAAGGPSEPFEGASATPDAESGDRASEGPVGASETMRRGQRLRAMAWGR